MWRERRIRRPSRQPRRSDPGCHGHVRAAALGWSCRVSPTDKERSNGSSSCHGGGLQHLLILLVHATRVYSCSVLVSKFLGAYCTLRYNGLKKQGKQRGFARIPAVLHMPCNAAYRTHHAGWRRCYRVREDDGHGRGRSRHRRFSKHTRVVGSGSVSTELLPALRS